MITKERDLETIKPTKPLSPERIGGNTPGNLQSASKFKEKYDKCDSQTQNLFRKLVENSSIYCFKHFPTDTPDYRLQKKYNFCLITLLPSQGTVRIHLRTDGLILASDTLQIKDLLNHHYNGKTWIEVCVNQENQVSETVRLIKEVYEFCD